MMKLDKISVSGSKNNLLLTLLEYGLILLPPFFPLLFNLPYRINIFLAWEGAYRLSVGQIPFKDFGMPLGFGFWLLPALFFKIFGPYLITLVKAQVFINIISHLTFRNCLKLLDVEISKRLLAILILIVSYSFPSFWPWYNHTVFVFQLVSINLLLLAFFGKTSNWKNFYVIGAAAFSFLSFYTKQDSGSIAIVFGAILLLYNGILKRNYRYLSIYALSVIFFGIVFIVPFLKYDFLYWFNLGQAPHTSRVSTYSFLNNFFSESNWEKFYIFLVIVIIWHKFKNINILKDEKFSVFTLITIGIILQAIIIRVTSPLTPDGQNYFHAFAFAFLIGNVFLNINLKKIYNLIPFALLILLWWSPLFWDYTQRIFKISPPSKKTTQPISSIQSRWTTSNLKGFKKITMPEATIEGIRNLIEYSNDKTNLKVLNMTELTPLALELDYTPLTQQPLWFHVNVGMFEKEIELLNKRVRSKEYDIVLFQSIPGLDNFFPYDVQEVLKENYFLIDSFEAPRKRSEGYSEIEVYVKHKDLSQVGLDPSKNLHE